MTLVPADLAGFYAFPVINFLAIALIGRGAALRLSNALIGREDARSELEKKNQALRDAQAELHTTNEQLQVELYERKRAEKASLQAKDLTQQLLTFSKGGEPVKKLVNLVELVKNSATFSLFCTQQKKSY